MARWALAGSRTRRSTVFVAIAATASLALAACGGGSGGSSGGGDKVGVALITKNVTNPFFVAMQNGAKEAAAKNNVNLTLAAGKADLVALARPHLANPYFTLQASAWYQEMGQYWPPQYLPGRDQAYRNAVRERAEQTDLKLRARPASHEVKDDPKAGVKRAA